MDPQVVAAIVTAAVSVPTVVGTLAAQYLGRGATSSDIAAGQVGSGKPAAVRLAAVYAMAAWLSPAAKSGPLPSLDTA
jgi:hypothetical protein